MKTLMDSPRFPSEGGSTWGPSPCSGLSPPPTTMTPLTSCPSSRLPRCYPCQPILPSMEERSGSPAFTQRLCLHATLFDPGGAPGPCPLTGPRMVPSRLSTPSASSHSDVTGLNRFSPRACGLQTPCPRLTHAVADIGSGPGMEYAGSALLQWLSQPLAVRHFVAHRQLP